MGRKDTSPTQPRRCRWEMGGEDLGLGSVSASMELRELHSSLLPGLQFSYSDAKQVPTHPPPTPSFEVCHANPAPWSYQSRKSGRGWGRALEAKGPGISGGLQGADPTSCPSVSELFEHRKSQLRRP